MNDTTAASTLHKSRGAFLEDGMINVSLDTALDCSICREPLLFNAAKNGSSLPHLPQVLGIGSKKLGEQTLYNTTKMLADDSLQPEQPVRIAPCNHVFGRLCLENWFIIAKSNRCPECNQELFPRPFIKLHLQFPTSTTRLEFARHVEEIIGDVEMAAVIRARLMTDWTRELICEFAMQLWRNEGYEVEYEYADGSGGGEEEEEEENEEKEEEEMEEEENNSEHEEDKAADDESGEID